MPSLRSSRITGIAEGGADQFRIAANMVQGSAVWRVNEVLIQPQGFEISSGCGSGQTGADQPSYIAGEEPRSRWRSVRACCSLASSS